MPLWSSSRPGIKARVLTKLPATFTASGGLSVEKSAGIWTLSPDWSALSEVTSVSNADSTQLWIRNADTDVYNTITASALIASIASSGAGLSFPIKFDSDTTDSAPASGYFRFDNSDAESATTIYVNLTDSNGLDITDILDSFDDSTSTVTGDLSITKIGDATKRVVYEVSAVTSETGYRKITIALKAASDAVPFIADDACLVQFVRNGDASGGTVDADNVDIDGATALTAPAVDDEAVVYDTSATANRKITLANLWKVIDSLTALTAPDVADELPVYDASGTATDKITLANLFKVINTMTADSSPDIASDYVTTYDASASAAKKVLLNKLVIGKFTVGASAGSLFAATSNGCANVAQAETSSNKINYKYLAFDPSSIEYAWCWIPTPKSYNASTLTARFNWTHPATTTNFGVVWQIEILSLSDDDAIDTAVGTAVTVADTGGTTQDFYQSAATASVTPSNTAAKQDWLAIRISRKTDHASDTMAVDAHLIGVEFYYTTDASTDD